MPWVSGATYLRLTAGSKPAAWASHLSAAIRKFGKKISFVHFRDVRGVPQKFEETWHDAGKTDT